MFLEFIIWIALEQVIFHTNLVKYNLCFTSQMHGLFISDAREFV